MKVAFDTSVLVAATHLTHRDHARAIVWMDAVATGALHGTISVHALGELWSVLTKLPVSPRISAQTAREVIKGLEASFEALPLTLQIYRDALDRCSSKGLSSGAIFDALHLATAEAAGVVALITFNEQDFTRLSAGDSPTIIVPPDPPAVLFQTSG